MFNNRKVVVVMPAYNAAKTLQKTWDEVMAQQIVDLVIVVDDGSIDRSVEITIDLDLPYSVRCLRQSNLGPGAARNRLR